MAEVAGPEDDGAADDGADAGGVPDGTPWGGGPPAVQPVSDRSITSVTAFPVNILRPLTRQA